MPNAEDRSGDRAGDEAIPRLGFNPPEVRVAGFEIVELATLHRRRARRGRPLAFHRVDFHTLTLVTSGGGDHSIDFVTYPCRPGTLLWVRPGQVQRFDGQAATGGIHLLFTATFPPVFSSAERLVTPWYGAACWQLGASAEYATLATLFAQLRAEFDRPNGVVSAEILQLQLATLLLHIDRLPSLSGRADPLAGGEVYARFRSELERSYAQTRRAEDYARQLGYSVKTLTRACRAAAGQPVKQVIDTRVALEAQRLLAHTDDPVATIARRLGFTEPTNFGKFFTHLTGTSPGRFRSAHSSSDVLTRDVKPPSPVPLDRR